LSKKTKPIKANLSPIYRPKEWEKAKNRPRLLPVSRIFALAYNLDNFLRRLVLPNSVKKWLLRTLREKLIRSGAKILSHSRYVIFQMAEVVFRISPKFVEIAM